MSRYSCLSSRYAWAAGTRPASRSCSTRSRAACHAASRWSPALAQADSAAARTHPATRTFIDFSSVPCVVTNPLQGAEKCLTASFYACCSPILAVPRSMAVAATQQAEHERDEEQGGECREQQPADHRAA